MTASCSATFATRSLRQSRPVHGPPTGQRIVSRLTATLVAAICVGMGASSAVSQTPGDRTTAAESPSPAVEDARSQKPGEVPDAPEAHAADADRWQRLAGKWETCKFGGDGPVKLPQPLRPASVIRLGRGDPLTGIRWTGDFPKENYELRLQGRRIEGFDFFGAVTFPIGDEHCSLVLGGWGGNIVGISSIDGEDASSNPTTQAKRFPNGKWVDIRIRVTPDTLTCWLDGQEWVNVERERHSFDIRIELDPSLPLGIANYQCVSEIRKPQFRVLDQNGDAATPSQDKPATSP